MDRRKTPDRRADVRRQLDQHETQQIEAREGVQAGIDTLKSLLEDIQQKSKDD